MSTPHIWLHVTMAPGERRSLQVDLPAGSYRLRTLEPGPQCDLDFAVLPIGDNFTMGVESAVLASDFIKCDRIMGYHYDTFGYIEIDHSAAKEAFSKGGKELLLVPIGDSVEV